jgi:hypothetical protein
MVGGVLDRGRDASIPTQSQPGKHHPTIDSETDELLMQIIRAVQEAPPIMTSDTSTSTSHSLRQTYVAVNTLVQHVTNRWRMEISRIVSTKFNSFCLVAFHDDFGSFLRKEMSEYLEELGSDLD